MAGGGFIDHMIASLKTNKRARISTFDKIKNFKKSKESKLIFPKKASKRDLKEVRKKIKNQNNINFFRKVALIVITLIIIYIIIRIDNY